MCIADADTAMLDSHLFCPKELLLSFDVFPLSNTHSLCLPGFFVLFIFTEGPKTIKFRLLTGAEAKPKNVATKKNLRPLEVQVSHLEQIVSGIRRDETWLSRRQEEMRELNANTASQVLWFNVVAIIILVGTGLLQIWYLKRYFRAKKLMDD